MKHKHDDPVASPHYAHIHKSIKYVAMLLRKALINELPHSKTQQVDDFTYQRKTSDGLVIVTRDVMFAPAKTLLRQVFLQKFPFLFIYNSLYIHICALELSNHPQSRGDNSKSSCYRIAKLVSQT